MTYASALDEDEAERRQTEHKELAAQVPDLLHVAYGKVFPKEGGTPSPRWRAADLYVAAYTTAVAAFHHDGSMTVALDAFDLSTVGVPILVSDGDD